MSSLLPSWHDAMAERVQAFVANVTDPGSKEFVAPSDRIATFDNDGTLWCEKPLYVQLAFVLERVQALAAQHPEWAQQEPFSSVLSGDPERLRQLTMPNDVLPLVAATHAGMTQAEFDAHVATFLAQARHPRFQRPYEALVYQPMIELVQYLQQHQFTVYLCSAGGLDFMRNIAARVYGISPAQVIGTSIQKVYQPDGTFQRTAELVPPLNDRAGKPVHIDRHIGKRPILAAGNSDGDLDMLTYTTQGSGASLALLLHHDDGDREYAYDAGAQTALVHAQPPQWLVVSMRSDFKKIWPE